MEKNPSLVDALMAILPETLPANVQKQKKDGIGPPDSEVVKNMKDWMRNKLKDYSHMAVLGCACRLGKIEIPKSKLDEGVHAAMNELNDRPKYSRDDREEIQLVLDHARKFLDSSPPEKIQVLDQLQQNLDSVVLVVRKLDLKEKNDKSGKRIFELNSKDLGQRKVRIGEKPENPICKETKYASQRSASSLGTGFFVSSDKIATAAHVLHPPFQDLKLKDIRFIKGFKVTKSNEYDHFITVREDQIFKPKKNGFFRDYLSSLSADWAVIEVTRENGDPANESHVVGISTTVKEGAKVYGLGCGLGQPVKVSYRGEVTKLENPNFFECNLDFFFGNSGSPVFDPNTNHVVGMLVRGRREFVLTGKTNKEDDKECLVPSGDTKNGGGEECQLMDPILEVLKKIN